MSKRTIIDAALKQKVVPVFSHLAVETCTQVMLACHRAGSKIFEFTNRHPCAVEVFKRLRKVAQEQCPGLFLGAGTVRRREAAVDFYEAGAEFIVGPNTNAEIIALSHEHPELLYCPGCATPTEIEFAQEALGENESLIKVYPGEVLKPEFVKAFRPTNPTVLLMATGGVEATEASLKAWFGAGTNVVGMGSNLIPKEMVASGDWAGIERKVSDVLKMAAGIEVAGF